MSGSHPHVIVGLGEVLWDCFADSRRPGGAPANLAYHTGQLGERGWIVSRVGSDEAGAALCDTLASRGLDLSFVQRDREHPTGQVDVLAASGLEPRYEIHAHSAWDHLELEPALLELARSADAIAFGTLAQRKEWSQATIHHCLEAAEKALLVFDVNLRQSWYTPATLRRSLARATVVKLNEMESRTVPALLELHRREGEDFARYLVDQFGVELVAITRGKRGCILISAQETVELEGIRTTVRDTVGAGDAFTAALITGRLHRLELRAMAEFANAMGALVASHQGAMPELGEQVEELRERFLGKARGA